MNSPITTSDVRTESEATEPVLSIITPIRNGERFLRECLECVRIVADPRIEHIVVDGASNDGTIGILKSESQRRAEGFRWISEPDSGQSDAMNKGIRMARGSWISFLNADDYYLPGTLIGMLRRVSENPDPRFLAGNCRIINTSGECTYIARPARFSWHALYVSVQYATFPINPCSYFYPKSVHDLMGMYDLDNHHTMDVDFLLKALRVLKYDYINEDWGVMRRIPGTKTYEGFASGAGHDRVRETIRKNYATLQKRERARVRVLRLWRGIKILCGNRPDKVRDGN